MIWNVNIWVATYSRQMKLNWPNVEQKKIYSWKFERKTQRYVDFMNNFTTFRYAHCLRYDACQVGSPDPVKHVAAFVFEHFLPCSNLHCSWWIFSEFSHKSTLHSFVQLCSCLFYQKRNFFFQSMAQWHNGIPTPGKNKHRILSCF